MTTDKAAAPVGAVPQDIAARLRHESGAGWHGDFAAFLASAADLIESQQAALASQAARMGEQAAKWRNGAAALEANNLRSICDMARAECYRSCADAIDKLRGEAG